ncbi:hypothetical protein B0H14DRAFT_3515055 [Mycena olivaceomarginata]|nr:hypothetical protein B0H14DRAFT_3515055 [Mycena olivaceomarginata]
MRGSVPVHRASEHRVLAPDSLQRLALAPDSLDVRSLRTRLAARAPGLRSVFAQRARLLPAAAANASDSRVLAQDRPLQMQLVLRCPSSRERCTPSTVHGRKSQGKLRVRAPSSRRRCLPLLRRMGGSMGWKLARLIRGIFWHTRAASGEDRGGLETRVDWISDTTVQVTTEKLEGRVMENSGYCTGGTRPRSCFPGAERYAPLLARHDLVTAIHAARRRLSALARAPTRLSPRARSALASVLDSNHTSALPLAPDSPNLRSSRSCARAPPRALHPRPALAAVLCCLVPTQLCSLRVGLRDGVSNSAALLAGGIGGNGYYTSWEARLGPLVEADDAQVAPSLHRYDQARASLTLTPSGRILKPCGRVRGRKLARSQRASTPVLGAGFASGAYPSSLCRTTYLSSERAWTLLDEERRTGTRLQANLEWGATWGAVYDHAASYSPLTFAGAGGRLVRAVWGGLFQPARWYSSALGSPSSASFARRLRLREASHTVLVSNFVATSAITNRGRHTGVVGLDPSDYDEGRRQRVNENPARDTHTPALLQLMLIRPRLRAGSFANLCIHQALRALARVPRLLPSRIHRALACRCTRLPRLCEA